MKDLRQIDYIEINRKSWNNRTDIHFNSAFYDNETFIKSPNSLNDIELKLLGDVSGLSILHLQCHFGQDSISLQKLGAEVVGVDLSDKSIERANELKKMTNAEVEFICCNIYDLPNHLARKFDIVFTSYGTIGWLPDMDQWAKIIAHFLKPDGRLVFAEFHPMVWMYDDYFKKITYSYFNTGPLLETESGTYADKNAPIKQEYVFWNHSISEVLNALLKQGMTILSFNEFDYSPYDCFKETEKLGLKKYRIKAFESNMPLVYSLDAKLTKRLYSFCNNVALGLTIFDPNQMQFCLN